MPDISEGLSPDLSLLLPLHHQLSSDVLVDVLALGASLHELNWVDLVGRVRLHVLLVLRVGGHVAVEAHVLLVFNKVGQLEFAASFCLLVASNSHVRVDSGLFGGQAQTVTIDGLYFSACLTP